MSGRQIRIPEWVFGRTGAHFLLVIRPDGTASVDGCHDEPAGVATARDEAVERALATVQAALERLPVGSAQRMDALASLGGIESALRGAFAPEAAPRASGEVE